MGMVLPMLTGGGGRMRPPLRGSCRYPPLAMEPQGVGYPFYLTYFCARVRKSLVTSSRVLPLVSGTSLKANIQQIRQITA